MRTDRPGPLTPRERALLEGFLQHDFPGVGELRQQVGHLTAKKGCACGCGTVDFIVDPGTVPRSAAASPVPVQASVKTATGDEMGGLILFVRDGVLGSLEIFSYFDPLPLPEPEAVTWQS